MPEENHGSSPSTWRVIPRDYFGTTPLLAEGCAEWGERVAWLVASAGHAGRAAAGARGGRRVRHRPLLGPPHRARPAQRRQPPPGVSSPAGAKVLCVGAALRAGAAGDAAACARPADRRGMAVRAHPARVSRRAARELLRQPRHARPPARRRPLRCAALARTAVGRDADPVRPGDARKVHLWRSATARLPGLRSEPRGACRRGERGGGVGGQAVGGLRRRALHDPRRRRRVDPRHRPLPRPARFAGAANHAVRGAGRRHDRARSVREPRLRDEKVELIPRAVSLA